MNGTPDIAAAPLRHTRLPANGRGRDLIVGDLHGCRAALDRALRALDFDPAADRVLCVGDLVDRGPDSPGCLALLDKPWFHAVMGNHEDMMCRRLAGDDSIAALHLENGGDWLPEPGQLETDSRLAANARAAAALPHMITVDGDGERYHVIHAELPAGASGPVTDAEIDAGAIPDPSVLLWRRELMLGGNSQTPTEHPGLSPTYCGHTPRPEVRRRRSHICLDTGAVFGLLMGEAAGTLSIAERRDGREVELHRFTP